MTSSVFGLVTFVVTTILGMILIAIIKDSEADTLLAMSAVITPVTGLVGVLVGTVVRVRTASAADPTQA